MYATKVIYIGKNKQKYELLLPIIFSNKSYVDYTTVSFDGTTALFSNARIEGNTLVVSGATINNNILIMEE